jgi:hypothetical protein
VKITATGPFLAVLAIYLLLRAPQRLPYFVVFFAPFSATAIVNFTGLSYKSGGVGLTPAMLFLLCYFVSLAAYGSALRSVVVSKGLLIQMLLIGVFVLLLLVSTAVNGLTEGLTPFEVTQTIYVLLGFAATVTLSFEFCRDGAIERCVRTAKAAAVFTSAWGILQVACYYSGVPYPSFMFNNSLSDFADMFDQYGEGFVRIASVAVEPSFFAASLLHFVSFGITVLVIEPRVRTRGWIAAVAFCTVTLLLCTSTTGYFGLAVLAAILLIRFPVRSIAPAAGTAALFGLAVVSIPKLATMVASATIEKNQTGSFRDRTQGSVEAFRMFIEHPLLGSGWGAGSNANAITVMLANVGALGTTAFLIACLATLFELQSRRSANRTGPHWRLAAYAAGVQNALIVAFACAVSSGIKYVVLDDWYFWALGIAIASRLTATVQPYGAMPSPVVASGSQFTALARYGDRQPDLLS